MKRKVNVSVVQESPFFFDKGKILDQIEQITVSCAKAGADLVLFPESFLPGYPRGFDFGSKIGRRSGPGRELYLEYYQNSFDPSGPEAERLEKLSNRSGVYIVLGVTERGARDGSLYCSMVYVSPHKGIIGIHRKIKPTGVERLIWGEGDGSGLLSFDTDIGRLGGLICWENYMPEARLSIYRQGVEIYLAPTADARESWSATMRHIALEGRCFVLGCNQYFNKSFYPERFQSLVESESENFCDGGSIIVAPSGEVISGPLFGESGILHAELDLDLCTRYRLDFDVCGHYGRPDIFDLTVKDQPEPKNDRI